MVQGTYSVALLFGTLWFGLFDPNVSLRLDAEFGASAAAARVALIALGLGVAATILVYNQIPLMRWAAQGSGPSREVWLPRYERQLLRRPPLVSVWIAALFLSLALGALTVAYVLNGA